MPYNYKDFGEEERRTRRHYETSQASQSVPESSTSDQDREQPTRSPQHFTFGSSGNLVPHRSTSGYIFPSAEQTFSYQTAWQGVPSDPYAYSRPAFYQPPPSDASRHWQQQMFSSIPASYHFGQAMPSETLEGAFYPSAASAFAINAQNSFGSQPLQFPRRQSLRSNDNDHQDEECTSQESLSLSVNVEAITEQKKRKRRMKSGKRFTWTPDAHRDFVRATFTTGLAHALPQHLAGAMSTKDHQVSPETARYYLLKYREKLEEQLYLGQGTYPTVALRQVQQESASATDDAGKEGGARPLASPKYVLLTLPQLTPEEAASQLGSSLGYLLGLLRSLEHQLMLRRATATPPPPDATPRADDESPRASPSAASLPPLPLQEAQDQLLRLRATVLRRAAAVDDDPSPARSTASGAAAMDARTLSLEETLELSSLEDALEDDDKLFSFLNSL